MAALDTRERAAVQLVPASAASPDEWLIIGFEEACAALADPRLSVSPARDREWGQAAAPTVLVDERKP